MPFPSITEFKNRLLDGGARPSLFEMRISFPPALNLAGLPANSAEFMRFHCRISEIPGTTLNPIIVKFAGREVKYAGQRTFNNLQVTIMNDEAFTIRRALETWFEAMNSSEGNISALTSPTVLGYSGTGEVIQYKKTGSTQGAEVARRYRFVELFPLELAPIALDWSQDAAIEEYTCSFAYQYWEPITGNA